MAISTVSSGHSVRPVADVGWPEILGAWFRWSLVILIVALVGGAAALLLATRMEPTYNSEAVLLYDRPDPGRVDNAADPTQVDSMQRAALARSQVEILRSNELARQVIAELDLARAPMFQQAPDLRDHIKAIGAWLVAWLPGGLSDPEGSSGPDTENDRLVQAYVERLTVRQETDTYVLRVGFRAPDAALAARVANAHIDAYLADLREQRAKAVAETSTWLNQAVASAQTRVVAAEAAIESFRTRTSLVDLDGRTSLDQGLSQMSADLAAAQANLVSRQTRARELRRLQDAGQIAGIASMSGSAVLADLQDKYTEASASAAALRRDLGERHPQLQAAERRRAELRAAIQTETRNLVDGEGRQAEIASIAVASLKAALDGLKQQALGATGQRASLARLEAEAEAERGAYLSLVQKLRSFDNVGELVRAEATLLSPALIPSQPSAPRKGLFAAFGFCLSGGLVAAGLAWRETRRDVVRHTGDAAVHGGARCLAVMPAFDRLGDGSFDRAQPNFSFFQQQLRLLCAVLSTDYTQPGTRSVSVLVTSSLPGEGKSTFCRELGRFAARNGIPTLIVNADPKTPAGKHGPFGERLTRLEQESELYGTTLAPAAISSWHMYARDAINAWRREFGLVILDTAPVSATAESRLLAPIADATLIVVRAGLTPRSLLAGVSQEIESAGGKLAGLILSFAHLDRQQGVLPSDIGYYFRQNRSYHKRLVSLDRARDAERLDG